MGLYAIIKGEEVDGIAIADAPLDTDGVWIEITDMTPQPGPTWKYVDGVFTPPPAPPAPVMPAEPPPPPKTEEQKIADATAAAIAKLIADGVLKQA